MEFKKLKGKYIGFFKIKKATLHDSKTYFGKERVLIEYEESKELEEKYGKILPVVLPQKTLAYIVTDKMSDFTEVQRAKVKPIVSEIMAVLMESELDMDDLKFLINSNLMETIKEVYNRADAILWTKPYYKLTLGDIDKVLNTSKKHGRKKKA